MPKTGRIAIKGTHRVEKKYERSSYKIEMKQAVVNYWRECNDVDSTLNKFWPKSSDEERETKRKLLYAWKAQITQNENAIKPGLHVSKIQPSGIACVLPSDVEKYLANWVRSLRNEGIPISNQMMCLQAKILPEERGLSSDQFKASHKWQTEFKDRFRLSSRTKTNQGQVSPDDIQKQQEEFAKKVKETAKHLGVKVIWNADQTPVQYEMIPKKNVDNINQKTM